MVKVRTVQICLLSAARLFCQGNRLSLGGLLPLITPEIGLSTSEKGTLLSAFPLGYMFTQVLGGAASDRWGGRPVMGLALISTAIFTVVFGQLSSFYALWLTLLLSGLVQGPTFPTNGAMIGAWIPRTERAFSTAVTDCGGPIGGLLALFGTPILAAAVGWRLATGILGLATLCFALVWCSFASNRPTSCSYISSDETKELQQLGVITSSEQKKGTSSKSAFPWKMLTISSVWSVYIAHVCFNYNRYLTYNWVVTYLTDGLKLPISVAGGCMLAPTIVDAVSSCAVGWAADKISNSGKLSTSNVRRIFTGSGFFMSGCAALALGYISSPMQATILLSIGGVAEGCHNAGFKSSYGELSQSYAGFLSGIGNTLASASSFVVPLVVAYLLESSGGAADITAWRVVFSSVIASSSVGAIMYSILVTTDSIDFQLQPTDEKKQK